MGTLAEQIVAAIAGTPGISDRELAMAIFGGDADWRDITAACRALAEDGRLRRELRPDGVMGNYPLRGPIALA